MALRKANPATAPNGKAAAGRTQARVAAPDTTIEVATPEAASSQRLLREAAWSRMFGRTESKNPFARSR